MGKPKTAGRAAARAVAEKPLREWARPFLAALAETSNVKRAAKEAGLNGTAQVYDARRTNRAFARDWQTALAEGYDNLEIELLGRLREGEIKRASGAKTGVRTYDNATAFRLLTVHREARAKEQARRTNVSAAEVRASIDRKLAALKAKVLAEREADQAADD
jgi:hypothetical protein